MIDKETNTGQLIEIHDEGASCYFHVMLNMEDDELDPYEYRLLGHYRRVCGAHNVPCTESTKTTADVCRMSAGKVSKTRQALAAAGWIRLSEDGNKLVVMLVDRMPENVERFSQKKRSPGERSQNDRSPHERNVHHMNETLITRTKRSPHERDRSPGERKKELKELKEQQEPARTSSSSTTQITAPARAASADDDDETAFIQAEAQKLGLNDEWQRTLVSQGPEIAAALLLHVRSKASSSPAGLLVTMLSQEQPPPEDALQRAALALELQTVDVERIDRHRRQLEVERLKADAREIAERELRSAECELKSEEGGADSEESSAPAEDAAAGLDAAPGRGALTVREIWQAVVGQLRCQLNQGTFDTWVSGSTAERYADGVLTIRARHAYGADWLARNLQGEVERIASDIAGTAVAVQFEAARARCARGGAR